MHFSELFIRRPVASMVLGAFILLLGFYGILNMAVRQYPEVEETVVTITTTYPGAPADLIQGFITAPIAAAVATTENIDYLTSQSTPSVSIVSVNMKLGSNPDVALTEVLSKVQQVRGELPDDAEDPVIVKGTGFDFALMYLIALNPKMTQEQITEYLDRVIRPRMSTIPGVAEIEIIGAANYAMRVWIDPLKLAARGVTAAEVGEAIEASNFLAAPGTTENEYRRLQHQPAVDAADAGGLRRAAAEVRRRRGCAAARRGDGRACVRGAGGDRHLQPPARHLHRGVPDAGGQPARCRRRGDRRAAGDQRGPARRHGDQPGLRLDRPDQRLDRRGVQDDRRGGGDRGRSSSCSSSARSARC